jgi:hypothetical protein
MAENGTSSALRTPPTNLQVRGKRQHYMSSSPIRRVHVRKKRAAQKFPVFAFPKGRLVNVSHVAPHPSHRPPKEKRHKLPECYGVFFSRTRGRRPGIALQNAFRREGSAFEGTLREGRGIAGRRRHEKANGIAGGTEPRRTLRNVTFCGNWEQRKDRAGCKSSRSRFSLRFFENKVAKLGSAGLSHSFRTALPVPWMPEMDPSTRA